MSSPPVALYVIRKRWSFLWAGLALNKGEGLDEWRDSWIHPTPGSLV